MLGERRFPFEKAERLESPERHERQPATKLVELVARDGGKRILDIGVGTGYFALPLAQRLPTSQIIALDVEPRMLELVRSRAAELSLTERVKTIEAAPAHIPLPDSSVDVVLMVNLYHELDDRAGYLKEVARVLAPRGRLIVCDWDPESTSDAGPPRDHRVMATQAQVELEAADFLRVQREQLYTDFYTFVGTRPD